MQLIQIGLAIALACVTAYAGALQQQGDNHWEQVCRVATARRLVPPTFAKPNSENDLKGCDAEALYYGFEHAPGPVAALQCAYYQRAHPDPKRGDPFYGPGVLMMLYANGKSVTRDYDLAIRFACEEEWIHDGGMNPRIARLEHLRDTQAQVSDFDLCDHGTSGLMQGACTEVRERFADGRRKKELRALSRNWTSEVKGAFELLQRAENDFEEVRTSKEVDLTGTGRNAFALREQGRLRDQFLINLKRFSKHDIPADSAADELAVNRRLNAAYQKTQNSPAEAWKYGTTNPAGIRETQLRWLRLREAWVKFGRVAYPDLDPGRIATQITRLRVHQLDSL